ncbi:MAG: MFS transporter [Clostridia bacterium]|nr:MFS transporter [Clostridia bacterium]
MTKEEKILKKNMKKNLKLYYIYKMFSWDLVFYYAISFLFLNNYKGLTSAEIIFADAFYPFFKILFQLPSTILAEKFGKRSAIIIGNISLAIYILFILGCNNMYLLILGNVFMAFGFVLKNLCETNILYDSLPKGTKKQKAFSKIDGRSSAIYYVFEAISCILSGYLYKINPNIPIILCLICTIISLILAHFFSEVPKDINNLDESQVSYKNSVTSLKQYIRNLKNAFKFIFSSGRLRALIYFNATFISIIYLLVSYRRSLLIEIGISSENIGIIFAILGICSGIGSTLTAKINKTFQNKTLTYFGLYYTFSIIISGLVVVLNIPFIPMISLIVLMLSIQFFIKGPYYTLIKQYLGSFASSSMRIKISAASYLIEGLITGLVSFFGAWLLTFTDTAHASIIVGCIAFITIVLLLEYMRPRVGLKAEEYEPSEINFKEVE